MLNYKFIFLFGIFLFCFDLGASQVPLTKEHHNRIEQLLQVVELSEDQQQELHTLVSRTNGRERSAYVILLGITRNELAVKHKKAHRSIISRSFDDLSGDAQELLKQQEQDARQVLDQQIQRIINFNDALSKA